MKKSLLLFFILVVGLQKAFAQTTPFIYTDTVDPIINLNITGAEVQPFLDSTIYPASRSITVPFRTSGTFNSGNQFNIMLSDTLGAFGPGKSKVIATLSASGNVGNRSVVAVIPGTDLWSNDEINGPAIPSGTRYRIRVESTNPPIIGTANATPIRVGDPNIAIAMVDTLVDQLTPDDLRIMLDWINKKLLFKDLEFCYKDTKTRDPAAAPNTFPENCGDGLVKYGALCYQACADNYSNVVGVCWESCRSGWIDGGIFCYPSYSTMSTPSRLGDCPSEYDNTGIECYRWFRSDYHPSQLANCPSGYTNMGLTCYRPWSIPIDDFPLSDSRATCPSGYFKGFAGRCYYNCGPGWNNDGDFCSRPASSISYANGMYCPAGYEPLSDFAFGRCYQRCEQGWHSTYEFCQLDVLSSLKGSYVLTPYPLQCNTGYEVQYVPFPLCYPKCETSYVGVGPVCWTKCDPLFDCGVACATDLSACAMAVADMAVSTIMLIKSVAASALTAVAVATVVGSAAVPAIMAANNAISIATRVGIKVIKAGLNAKKAGRAWIFVMKGVQKVRKFGTDFNKLSKANKALKVFCWTKSAYSTGNKIEQVTSYENRSLAAQMMNTDVYSAYKIYEEEIAKDFKENANPEIANIIDSKFPVHIATEIKKRWANQKLEKDAIDWFGLAGGILTAISTIATVAGLVSSFDPTGLGRVALDLVDVANAFLKPPCKRPPDFPTLSRNYLIIQ